MWGESSVSGCVQIHCVHSQSRLRVHDAACWLAADCHKQCAAWRLAPPHLVKALFASLQVCVLGACASQHRKQQQQFGGQVVRTAVTSTELSVPAGRGWTSARLQNTPAYEDWHPSSSAHPKKCAYLPSLSRLASSKSCESLQLLGTAPCWEPLLLQKVPGALLPSLLILL